LLIIYFYDSISYCDILLIYSLIFFLIFF